MNDSIRSINKGGLGKRLLAIIMDGTLFLFMWGLISLAILKPIADKAFGYSDTITKGEQYRTFSSLVVVSETIDEEKKVVDIENIDKLDSSSTLSTTVLYKYYTDDLDFYKNRIKYYYLNFKTNLDIKYPETIPEGIYEDAYYSADFDKEMTLKDGTKAFPRDYYTEAWFDEEFGKLETQNEWLNASYEATKDLFETPFFDELNTKVSKQQMFIRLPGLFLSFIGFYVVAPLCFKNGETLAKKVLKLGFVTKDGFDIKKRQMVMRQSLLAVYIFAFMFVFSFDLITSLCLTFLGAGIYVIATAISRTNRSLVDYASYVLLIDTGTSVWFKDANEEAEKEKQVAENLAKLNQEEALSKNVIQIGGTIVDEDIKKEFEEANKK